MQQPEAKQLSQETSGRRCVSTITNPTSRKANMGVGESAFVDSAALLEPSGPFLALLGIH